MSLGPQKSEEMRPSFATYAKDKPVYQKCIDRHNASKIKYQEERTKLKKLFDKIKSATKPRKANSAELIVKQISDAIDALLKCKGDMEFYRSVILDEMESLFEKKVIALQPKKHKELIEHIRQRKEIEGSDEEPLNTKLKRLHQTSVDFMAIHDKNAAAFEVSKSELTDAIRNEADVENLSRLINNFYEMAMRVFVSKKILRKFSRLLPILLGLMGFKRIRIILKISVILPKQRQ